MKTLILTLGISTTLSLSAQTKQETYEYINEKLDQWALTNSELNRDYYILENEASNDKFLIFVETNSIHPALSYTFYPKDFLNISYKDKPNAKWVDLNFTANALSVFVEDTKTNKATYTERDYKITIILDKATPEDEINRIKKAFLHLFKLYGVEKKELF